jgi:hypothetical protein
MKAQRESTFEPWRDITLAKVTPVDGSIIGSRPGHLWVVLWGEDGAPTQAFNPGFSLAEDDWVKIGLDPKGPFRWTILAYWAGDIEPEYLGRVARHSSGPHGWNHQWSTEATSGSDPVRIYQPALMLLKTSGNDTDLTITVQALEYNTGGYQRTFYGGQVDLTSSVPSTASHIRAVLVYLDTNTNTIKTIDGTSVLDNGAIEIPRPPVPSEGRISSYVFLTTGQTAVTTATDVDDARDFLAAGSDSASGGDTLPVPAEDSMVLMSDDALDWIAAMPVISEDGTWMVGYDDKLVWE